MNIRVGKDISLVWTILTEGLPEPLEGRELRLDVTDPCGTVTSVPFSVTENKVGLSLYGKDLTKTGAYSLTLWENKGKEGQTAVDCVSAFRLVANTLLEDDEEESSNIRAATLDLGYSNLEYAISVVAVGGGAGKGTRHINGAILLTATGNTIDFVSTMDTASGRVYRCYWKKSGNVEAAGNLWTVGDQAVSSNRGGGRKYWRLVTGTDKSEGEDMPGYHFVDLSAEDCAEGSAEPQEKDEIVQLGYRGDDAPERQVAIILSGEGAESPYIRQYAGIKGFDLPEAELQIRPGHNSMTAKVSLQQGSEGLKNLEEWAVVEAGLDEMKDNILQNRLDIIDIKDHLQLVQDDIEQNKGDIITALREAREALDKSNEANLDAAATKLLFEELASDEIISVAEKQALRTELARIRADYSDIQNELEQYEVADEESLWANYEAAYTAYKTDLETKVNTEGNVSVGDLLTLQDTYYDTRSLLLDGIYKAAKALADKANNAVAKVEQSIKDVQEDIEVANTVASEAQAAADKAQQDATAAANDAKNARDEADKANETFDAWAADGVISPLERKGVRDEYYFLMADKDDIDNQVAKYDLADKAYTTDFNNKYTAYYNDLYELVETKNIKEDGTTDIPVTMDANQEAYYAARTIILEKIAQAAKDVADNAVRIAEEAKANAIKMEDVQKNIDAAVNTLDDKMAGYVDETVAQINARLDGVVENFFLEGAPAIDKAPVTEWTTPTEKINHVGDTYTNISSYEEDPDNAGKSWRWCFCTETQPEGTYIEVTHGGVVKRLHWHPIADSDAVLALQKAAEAMTNADGRARTFVTKAQPLPPYDEGDLWLQGPDGDIMVCKQGIHRKEEDKSLPLGTLLADWEKASKYIDNAGLKDFFDGAFSEAIKDVQAQVDGKAETWYQDTDPSYNWSGDPSTHVGDLWYNTKEGKNYIYRKTGESTYEWKEIDGVPDGVYDYVDTKAQIFVSATKPAAPYNINDLWLKLVDNKATDIYRCVESKDTKGAEEDNDWELASYYTDNSELDNFIADVYGKDLEELKGQLDGKAETWYQANDPATQWKEEEKPLHVGDLWYDTGKSQNFIYIKAEDGTHQWKPVDGVPDGLYDYIDRKAQIFVGKDAPLSPYFERDLWVVLDTAGNATVIKRSQAKRTDKGNRYPTDWVSACNYADKAEVEGKFAEVAGQYESLEANVEDAAARLEKVYTKAEADGIINAAEAKAIAQAKAELEAAQKELEQYTDDQINGLSTGSQNLLVNSGFTGGFEVTSLNGGSNLKQMFSMFSPSLEYWEAQNTEVMEDSYTQTGKCVFLKQSGSRITQEIIHDIYAEKKYIVSFEGRGGNVKVAFGGMEETFSLAANWKRYVWKLTSASSFTAKTISFSTTNYAYIGDIKLEEGSIPSEWSISPYDNHSMMAKFQEGAYLQEVLKVRTEVEDGKVKTGLVNAGLILMGEVTGGMLAKTTAGLSGTYNNGNDVAFFGGGDLQKAIYAANFYASNPTAEPTEEELANMAKVVITHGGRAILEDAIIRGTIYAESGYFKGIVQAASLRTGVGSITDSVELNPDDTEHEINQYSLFAVGAVGAGTRTIKLPLIIHAGLGINRVGLEYSFLMSAPVTGITGGVDWNLQAATRIYNEDGTPAVVETIIYATSDTAATEEYSWITLPRKNKVYKFLATARGWIALQPIT